MKSQFYVFAMILISLAGCAKFLDKKTTNGIAIAHTISDLQALLDDAETVMNLGTPVSGEAASDDYFMPAEYYKALSPREQVFYKWQPNDYKWQNDWSSSYAPVYNANYCLELLKENERNPYNAAKWDNVYGSALFFRSYYFQQLSWVYTKAYDEATAATDPGIVLRLTYDFNVPSRRSSVADCYRQIVNDTREAAHYLPDYPVHVFRPSKAAAYALLARTFLSMRQYDSAHKYADRCLEIKNDLIDLNGDPDLAAFSTTYPFKRFNKETIFYTEMTKGDVWGLLSPTRSRVDSVLYASYEAQDLRQKAYFLKSGGYYYFRGSYAKAIGRFTGLATDEMYLIRAECNARKGPAGVPDALSDLNTLLVKRYASNGFTKITTSDAGELLNRILAERRKELVLRGLRWADIKRLNKEGRNIVLERIVEEQHYRLEPNANYYALPLPTDIITITGMPQNEQ